MPKPPGVKVTQNQASQVKRDPNAYWDAVRAGYAQKGDGLDWRNLYRCSDDSPCNKILYRRDQMCGDPCKPVEFDV